MQRGRVRSEAVGRRKQVCRFEERHLPSTLNAATRALRTAHQHLTQGSVSPCSASAAAFRGFRFVFEDRKAIGWLRIAAGNDAAGPEAVPVCRQRAAGKHSCPYAIQHAPCISPCQISSTAQLRKHGATYSTDNSHTRAVWVCRRSKPAGRPCTCCCTAAGRPEQRLPPCRPS